MTDLDPGQFEKLVEAALQVDPSGLSGKHRFEYTATIRHNPVTGLWDLTVAGYDGGNGHFEHQLTEAEAREHVARCHNKPVEQIGLRLDPWLE